MAVEAELESAEMPENVVSETSSDLPTAAGQLDGKGQQLMPGRKKSLQAQSLTIFYKRCLIVRRSWLSSLPTILIAVAGSCIPLFFMSNRAETCTTTFVPEVNVPLYKANSPYSSVLSTQLPGGEVIVSPSNLAATLGVSAA
jgi:hypothetical protein